ncbi:MAG: PAS domain S-box protein, partial [Nitrospinales bacterium]
MAKFSKVREKFQKEIDRHKQTKRALENRETYIHSVMDTAVDGIITIAENGVIELYNPAAERIFGYEAREVVGKNIKLLMPEPDHSQHDSYLKNYLTTGVPKIIGFGREVRGRRKDGSIVPIELAVGEMKLETGRMLVGILRDITDRKWAEEELKRYRDQLEIKVERRTADLAASNKKLEKEIRERIRAETQIKKSLREKETLLEEINHRAKNNMQIISSLLKLQLSAIRDARYAEIFRDIYNQIRAMALVHETIFSFSDIEEIDTYDFFSSLANGLL